MKISKILTESKLIDYWKKEMGGKVALKELLPMMKREFPRIRFATDVTSKQVCIYDSDNDVWGILMVLASNDQIAKVECIGDTDNGIDPRKVSEVFKKWIGNKSDFGYYEAKTKEGFIYEIRYIGRFDF